jgi:tetratricopeptide (TPR) repeat protein
MFYNSHHSKIPKSKIRNPQSAIHIPKSTYMMTKQQWWVVGSATAFFLILYFGCDTKSKFQKTVAASSHQTIAATDPQTLLTAARKALTPAQLAEIQPLEAALQPNLTPAQQADALKKVSGTFHRFGQEAAAAHFAEQVAELEKTEMAWSVAGGNYFLAIRQTQDKAIRDFCTQRAVAAFQNAASLNPKQLEHKINLALCYTENPLPDNPMKGILLLRELDAANPDNTAINVQLARLAIKTGQFDKAIARLEKVLAREPNLPTANCLAAEAYTGAGNAAKAAEVSKKCVK